MISLKEAVKIYNNPKPAGFWNFLAEKVLQVEKNNYVPSFVKKALVTEILKVKAKIIADLFQEEKLFSKVKQVLKTKRVKYSTIYLIKYTLQEYHEKIKKKGDNEMVLREGDVTIKIQKELNPCFDFYHHDPFYELKFNAKTKSIILKTLGSCKRSEGGFTWYRNNRLYVNLEIMNYNQVLILLFKYTVVRESRNYYYNFTSYSFYTVVKVLYVVKDPFYLIESRTRFRFFHDSPKSLSSNVSGLKRIFKKLTPKYEKDKPVFKTLKRKELILLSNKEEQI